MHRGDALPPNPCKCCRQCGCHSDYICMLLLLLLVVGGVALRGSKGRGP